MKALIITLFALLPCMAFSQAMHLPGAQLPKPSPKGVDSAKAKQTLKQLTNTLGLKWNDTSKTNTAATALIVKSLSEATKADTTVAGSSTPIVFKAAVLSTNFTIPLIRVNFLNKVPGSPSNALASTSFLNSAGAGINYSWGNIEETTDGKGNTLSADFYNEWGVQIGFLFASNSTSGTSTTTNSGSTTSSTTQSSTIFALMAGFSVLNFQIGAGYEFGSIAPGQKRTFVTIAYAIPVSTLVNGGYKIIQSSLKQITK